jgi:hypothetical protein
LYRRLGGGVQTPNGDLCWAEKTRLFLQKSRAGACKLEMRIQVGREGEKEKCYMNVVDVTSATFFPWILSTVWLTAVWVTVEGKRHVNWSMDIIKDSSVDEN